jgi:hypothetical protein
VALTVSLGQTRSDQGNNEEIDSNNAMWTALHCGPRQWSPHQTEPELNALSWPPNHCFGTQFLKWTVSVSDIYPAFLKENESNVWLISKRGA